MWSTDMQVWVSDLFVLFSEQKVETLNRLKKMADHFLFDFQNKNSRPEFLRYCVLRYAWKGSKMDQRECPEKACMAPSLVSLDANAAKAVLETKADPTIRMREQY